MMFERIGCRVGGAEDFDVEAVEELARRKFGEDNLSETESNKKSEFEADGFSSTLKTWLNS